MRVLMLGAGVIGSFNAARLTDAGRDLTLLARGRRLEDLREHSVVLEDFRTGQRTVTTGSAGGSAQARQCLRFDHRCRESRSALLRLPVLAQNHRIPSVLFLGNNAAGPQEMVDALGRDRVLLGMPNTGGCPAAFWHPCSGSRRLHCEPAGFFSTHHRLHQVVCP